MIELTGVSKRYGAVTALDNVTITIPDRARVAVLGPSGSGKTTLLRVLAGLEIPDTGTIAIDGTIVNDPGPLVPPAGRGIGFVFQVPALWPHMTVRNNILFAMGGIEPAEADRRLGDLLDRMSIAPLRDRYPDQISGGQARRVALARALAPRPSILLFDEPLTNLDDEIREELLTLIGESVKDSGATMVFVTHNKAEAGIVADTILKCRDGQITGPLVRTQGNGHDKTGSAPI
jgi:iron(III) transport system ATP-binding protein